MMLPVTPAELDESCTSTRPWAPGGRSRVGGGPVEDRACESDGTDPDETGRNEVADVASVENLFAKAQLYTSPQCNYEQVQLYDGINCGADQVRQNAVDPNDFEHVFAPPQPLEIDPLEPFSGLADLQADTDLASFTPPVLSPDCESDFGLGGAGAAWDPQSDIGFPFPDGSGDWEI